MHLSHSLASLGAQLAVDLISSGRSPPIPCPPSAAMAFRFSSALPSKSWRSDLTSAPGKSGKAFPGLSGTPLGRAADRGHGGEAVAALGSSSSSALAAPTLRVTSYASLTGIFDAVLRENKQRDQIQQLRDKLGLEDIKDHGNHTLNVFMLVRDLEELQGDNPEDKSASSPSSAEDEVPQARRKRQLPQRRPYTRGSKVDLDKADEDHEVVDELISAKFSAQGLYTLNIRVRWWAQRAQARGLSPWPLTPPLIALAATLLRKGGYRSAPCTYMPRSVSISDATTRGRKLCGWSSSIASARSPAALGHHVRLRPSTSMRLGPSSRSTRRSSSRGASRTTLGTR